jgi:hypothetical protein
MNRSEALIKFMGDCVSLSPVNENDEGEFFWRGCDVCNIVEGGILGNTVIEVHGYNSRTKAIDKLGKICPHCLHFYLYGEE